MQKVSEQEVTTRDQKKLKRTCVKNILLAVSVLIGKYKYFSIKYTLSVSKF